jgi:hypothetical protein
MSLIDNVGKTKRGILKDWQESSKSVLTTVLA